MLTTALWMEAHITDLRAAASHGMKTIYVRRQTEDNSVRDQVREKKHDGEVDLVVDSFLELSERLSGL
jgi:methionine salvage enolase-phosphatase E1